VIGLGDVFFKSADHDALRDSYTRNLGIAYGQHGAAFKWRSADENAREHLTAWGCLLGKRYRRRRARLQCGRPCASEFSAKHQ
jgi:hypothetical protein